MHPLTLKEALGLTHGKTVYILGWYNSDGSPQKCRITGKVQTWKTRPGEFRVTIKRGLYDYGEITHNSMERFSLTVPPSIHKNEVDRGRRRK